MRGFYLFLRELQLLNCFLMISSGYLHIEAEDGDKRETFNPDGNCLILSQPFQNRQDWSLPRRVAHPFPDFIMFANSYLSAVDNT
jgi:hypothetical protein